MTLKMKSSHRGPGSRAAASCERASALTLPIISGFRLEVNPKPCRAWAILAPMLALSCRCGDWRIYVALAGLLERWEANR